MYEIIYRVVRGLDGTICEVESTQAFVENGKVYVEEKIEKRGSEQ